MPSAPSDLNRMYTKWMILIIKVRYRSENGWQNMSLPIPKCFFFFFFFLQLLNKVTLVVTPKAESLPRHSSQLHSFTKPKPQLKTKEKSALFCNFNLVSQFVDASMFNSFISPPTAPPTLHTETTLWLLITDRHITLLSLHWF